MQNEVLMFWFEEITPASWWSKDDEFDQLIIDRFSATHAKAICCELFEWRKTAEGRLAEIIVLDQFSRNMFRNLPLCFAYDSMALTLAQEAVYVGADKALNAMQRSFLYIPFMHSESIEVHQVAVDLYKNNGVQFNLDFELKHKKIIQQFGRYPHRNKILGRTSTSEEIEFLKQDGSSF